MTAVAPSDAPHVQAPQTDAQDGMIARLCAKVATISPVIWLRVVILLVGVAILGLRGWHEWTDYNRTVETIEDNMATLARSLMQQTEDTLGMAGATLDNVLERVTMDGTSPEALERLTAVLEHIVASQLRINSLTIFDAGGNWLAGSSQLLQVVGNISDRRIFKHHKLSTSPTPYLGRPVRSRTRGQWVLPLSRRINNPDGSFAGVVVATIDAQHFAEVFAAYRSKTKGNIALLSEDGILLTFNPFREELVGADFSSHEFFREKQHQRPGGTYRYVSPVDGEARLSGYHFGNNYPVFMLVNVDRAEALADWFKAAGVRAAHVAGLLAVIGGLGWWLSRLLGRHEVAKAQLAVLASTDGLTGLANRRVFDESLQQVLAHSDDKRRAGLLTMDVNDFKLINDRFGHDVGDALLKEIGERLRKAVRATDTVARLGGDEFAVVLRDVRSEKDLAAIAHDLQAVLHEPLHHGSGPDRCRTSMGGAVSTGRGTLPETLLKQADLALYRCKADRSTTFRMFEPAMREEAQKKASALEIARKAVASDWIVPFYQPKVALATGAPAGFEALLRWRHPRNGIQLPDTIAPAFENTELGSAIGERMLSRVIQDMRGWLDAGIDFGHVAINASAPEVLRSDYAERVLDQLYRAGIPATCLKVEVTEGVFMGRNARNVEQALRTLHEAGVAVGLDDFGTGYASLTHLKRFPISEIKIDRSFVADLETDAGDAAVAKAVSSLGQNLGITVVAEGVETAGQASFLREHGCDLAQGFHFGHPMPGEEVPQLIERWRAAHPEESAAHGARGHIRLVKG